MDLERGPLEYLSRDELRPFPARPSFTSLVADELGGIAGTDARLGQAHADLADSAADLNDGFETDYSDAVSDDLEPPGAGTGLELSDRIVTGDNVDTVRVSVAGVLPPVDTPIELPFDGPPGPPPTGGGAPREHYEPETSEVYDS
jgi:hypothetical protein